MDVLDRIIQHGSMAVAELLRWPLPVAVARHACHTPVTNSSVARDEAQASA